MSTNTLPQSGDSITGAYVYSLQLDVSLLGIGLADIVTPVVTDKQVTFGSSAGAETISYTSDSGTAVSAPITSVGALQDASAFTYLSGGTTYLVSNVPLAGLATVGLLGSQVDVLPAGTFSSTQGQYIYPASGSVVAPAGLTLDPASDSGVKGDDVTNVTTPTIDGTGQAGATVTLEDGSTLVGTGVVGSNGTWSIETTPLAAGVHSLTAVDSNGAAVSAASPALTLSIETSAPVAPSAPVLAPGSDSGIKGDDITNVATPILTGTGTAGDTVTLLDGSVAVGSATVATDGTWSLQTIALASGTNSLTAVQTDPAGDASPTSATLNVTVDTATPSAPTTPVLAPGSDSGVPGGNDTNDTTPTLAGTGTAGDTVTLYDGTTQVGTATVAPNGTWSVVSDTLPEGPNSLMATQTDAAGNTSAASPALTVTIDTTPPVAPSEPALSPASDSGSQGDDITNDTTPVLTGTGIAGDTVKVLDGSTVVGSGQVAMDGTWAVAMAPLAAGTHTITATQTDDAGNVSTASPALTLTIDTTPPPTPQTPVLAPASDSGTLGDGITNDATPTVGGLGVAGDTITIDDGTTAIATTTVDDLGAWSLSLPTFAGGTHSLSAVQTDAAGNISAASTPLVLTIDTTIPPAPSAPVLSPLTDTGVQGDDITSDVSPTITGTGVAGDTITLDDGSMQVGSGVVAANGTWSVVTSPLLPGTHALTATETDVAGNQSAASGPLDLTIDLTPATTPSAPVLSPASDTGVKGDDITNVTTPVLNGSGPAGDIVDLYDGGATLVGSTTVGLDNVWTITSSTLTPGVHSLTAVYEVTPGVVSATSAPLTLDIDTTTPATLATPVLASSSDSGVKSDDITNDTTPVITGTGTADDTVTLNDSAGTLGTAVVGSDGAWSITSTTLTAGGYSLTATQTDVAGNTSLPSTALSLEIDTTTPATPSAPVLSPDSDSGAKGDDVTNIDTPTFSGTGTAGDTITLLSGNTVVGSGSVSQVDTWTITSTALLEGSNSLTATDIDPAGNVSAASSPLMVTIDTAAPIAPSNLVLAPNSDSGVQGDDITNVTAPVITGLGTAGDTVSLLDGATILGTATVAADGTWSVTSTPLAAATFSLTATETDSAGNVSTASAPLSLTIETTMQAAPSTPVLSPTSDSGIQGDDTTNVTTPVITGTGTAGDTVTLLDNGSAVGTGSVASDGTWSIQTSTLAPGTQSLTATEADVAGNTSVASPALSLDIDTATPATPSAPTLSPASDSGTKGDGITNDDTPVLTSTGTASDTLTLLDGTVAVGTAKVASNGTWSVATSALADGEHSLTAVETDVAGNLSAASAALVLDIDTATPSAPTGLALSGTTVEGTAAPGDTVKIGEDGQTLGTATAGSNGGFTYGLTTAQATGVNTITASATDVAGNTSPASSLVIGAYHWATAVSGVFDQSGAWRLNGATTTSTPSVATDLAYFDTGSPASYTVTGPGNAGEVRVDGDSVTYSGTLSLAGLQDSGTGQDTSLVVDDSGSLTLASGATITAAATVLVGASSPGTLTIIGSLSDASAIVGADGTVVAGSGAKWSTSGTLTLAGGSFILDDTATITGTLILDGGTLTAQPDGGGGTSVVLSNPLHGVAGTTTYIGSIDGATLTLTGLSTLTAGEVIYRGGTTILDGALPTAAAPAVVDGGTLELGGAPQLGNAYITTLAGTSNTLVLNAASAIVSSGGNDTVDAGSGAATINGGAGSLFVLGGSGSLVLNGATGPVTLFGGTGNTTVYGGAASAVIIGGSAGGQITGGAAGGNILVSTGVAGGTTTIQGVGGGDRIFGSSAGNDVLSLGSGRSSVLGGGGNTTINGGATGSVIFTGAGPTAVTSGSGGQDTIVGGSGGLSVYAAHGEAVFGNTGSLGVDGSTTGADSIIGGSGNLGVVGRGGNMLVVAGTGSSNIQTGNGASLIFASSGNMTLDGGTGSMQVIAGMGNSTIGEGSGPTTYDVVSGTAGGIEIISGFKVGSDHVDLFGYQPSQVTVLSNGTNSLLQLSDGTKLEFLGVPNPGASIVNI